MSITRHGVGSFLSQVVIHKDTVYLSGTVADNLDADIKGQTREVLAKIDKGLAQAGSDKSKLLSAMIWVKHIEDRTPMNEIWEAWIDKANPPARACVAAEMALPKFLVEIMVVAAR